jgi:multidrug efflux pump subunit AcrA (membrane-fusion protein)
MPPPPPIPPEVLAKIEAVKRIGAAIQLLRDEKLRGFRVDIEVDSTIYGAVPGSVMSISPSTVQDPDDRRYYYKARIQLQRQYMEINNNKLPVQVGMPLVADIQGPQRSVLRYIFQPFTRTMNNAFRESI